jgi:hypothetical protein
MKQQSRKWFDNAYEHLRSLLKEYEVPMPLCFYYLLDVPALPRGGTKPLKERVRARLALPSKREFLEEKTRILLEAVPRIQEAFPKIRTLIEFGRIRGDIDLIAFSESPIRYSDLPENLMSTYPLIDWNTLSEFRSTNARNFYIRTKEKQNITRRLRKAVKKTTRLIYGLEEDLTELRNVCLR